MELGALTVSVAALFAVGDSGAAGARVVGSLERTGFFLRPASAFRCLAAPLCHLLFRSHGGPLCDRYGSLAGAALVRRHDPDFLSLDPRVVSFRLEPAPRTGG